MERDFLSRAEKANARHTERMGAIGGIAAIIAGVVGGILHAVNAASGRVHTPSFWLMGLATAVAYGAV